MAFSEVLREIIKDLPWVESTRLIVGPLASRESVKDELLCQVSAIPAWCVGSMADLAREIAPASPRPLALSSQADALERIAKLAALKERAPSLCRHLRARPVAVKVARFLTALDRFHLNDADLEALLEVHGAKDAEMGALLAVVRQLWARGELVPWSDGAILRDAIAAIEAAIDTCASSDGHFREVNSAVQRYAGVNDRARPIPSSIWIWAFAELTPLEESFLSALARAGSSVRWLAPAGALEAARLGELGIEVVELEDAQNLIEAWEPHSVWDELHFLRDALATLRAQGVAWEEISIHVPDNQLHKRLARAKLHEWNVPIHDPTLPGGWKDETSWLWWRDALQAIAGGLKHEDVRAFLGPGPRREELFSAAFRRGIHGGAGQWAKLLRHLTDDRRPMTGDSDLGSGLKATLGAPEPDSGSSVSGLRAPVRDLAFLVDGAGIFARAMAPGEFLRAVERFVPLHSRDGTILLEFARHLREDRPYLEGARARLPRYVALFEEYLDSRARAASRRAPDGVSLVAHGVWLVRPSGHAFILGANTITRSPPMRDPWEADAIGDARPGREEAAQARRAWERLHFGLTREQRASRDEVLLRYALLGHGAVRVSGTAHDVDGNPLAKSRFFEKVAEGVVLAQRGGHESVGWTQVTRPESSTPEVIARELPRNPIADGRLRVTAFEDYLKCPFLYYSRHILKLEPEDELGLDADGRARGNILHRALKRFISHEIEVGPSASDETARERLLAVVDEEIRAEKIPGMFRHPPLVEKAAAALRASAITWLDWELENRRKHPDLKPLFVEEPVELPLFAGLTLVGRPDRVDSDGTHSVVVDYKTGRPPFIGKELRAGIGAQLLAYSAAVQALRGLEPAAAHYVSIASSGSKPVDATKGVFLEKHNKRLHTTHPRNSGLAKEEFGTLFEKVAANWTRAAQDLLAGKFTARPARGDAECNRCAYKPVCGRGSGSDEGEGGE